jgi:hypothetical protein
MEVGPGSPLTEIPKWGSYSTIMDIKPEATNADVGATAARVVGVQFLETLLAVMGTAERREDGLFLKNKAVQIKIVDIPESPNG